MLLKSNIHHKCPAGGKCHLIRWRYPGGYGGERYPNARAEGKYHPGGYDPLDRVGQAEPSNCEDGNGAVYMPSSVQSPSFRLKGEQIRFCTALKYLGLWFDGKLTAKRTAAKAERIVVSISRLMSNLGGQARVSVSF